MKLFVTRHGQTKLNKQKLMQGHLDEPLNDIGIEQAKEAAIALKDISFDAVYASPLVRARHTASIIGNVPLDQVITDERLLEFDFGPYEAKPYSELGLKMTLYWLLPEIFKAPKGVESIPDAIKRTTSFMDELKDKSYENVLIVCHGGIIRVICGYLEGKKNGIKWRPKPGNCEIRSYKI